MANSGKVLQVRLQEKIDTLANWLALDTDAKPFIPLAGEKINVKVPTDINSSTAGNQRPNYGGDGETIGYEIISKTGDGSTRFKDLPWDSALAADVYDWAKAAVKPSYSIGEITGRKELSISGAGTKVVSYDGDTADSLNIVGEGLITVTPDATNNKITIKTTANNYSLPAAGTSLGGVKTGGDVTINSGVITVNRAASADNAAIAGQVANSLVIKGAGTAVETFNGSTAGEVDFVAGSNVTITPEDGKITIASTNTDTKVYTKLATTTKAYLLGTSTAPTSSNKAVTTVADTGVYLDTTAGSLTATTFKGNLTGNVTGNADTATSAANATTAASADKTKGTLTLKAGTNQKTFNGSSNQTFEITAANLGLSTPLDFAGVTTTALTDGATTNPITLKDGSSYTAVAGDVVIRKDTDKEFLFVDGAWEELGDADSLTKAVTDLGAQEVKAGAGLTGGGAISGSPTLALATSGATAGNYGPSANASPAHGKSFSVPYITVDTYGRVTAASTKTITLPADSNTHYASTTVVASAAANTSDVTAVTPQPYINHIENGAVVGSYQVKNGNAINATTDASGNLILNHADTSSQASVAANGRKYITGVTLDGYGHVTGLTTGTETVTDTHHVSTTVVSSSASGTSDVTAEQTNPYVNHIENSAVRNSIRFVGGGKTTVKASADGSTITISSTDADTHYTTGITAGATGTTANSATTNGNTYIKIKDDNTHRGQIKITGSGATSVASDANGVITISSTNTTYNPFTTTAQGLTKASGNNGNILFGDNTWHGAISRGVSGHENDTTEDYIILCAGSATTNIL